MATANVKVGNTEYTLGKVADKEGDFWTPVGAHNGDPDYSFAERQEAGDQGGASTKLYVHVTTKGRVPSLPDWTQIPEPEPLGPCITIFASGTVTAYRLCEVAAEDKINTPRAGAASSPASPTAADKKPADDKKDGKPAAATDDKNKPSAAAEGATPAADAADKKPPQKIAVYAPTQMTPDPPLEHCWAPKLDRLKGKYFFVNCDNRAKVWCLPEVTDLGSRVRAMFRRYAPQREKEVEQIVKDHEADKESFMEKLVKELGPEPGVVEARTRERLTAIFARYDRARLDDFEQLLADNVGKEEALIQSLLKEYGVEGKEPPTYRERLTALYEKYDQSKLATVDETLRVYHGKELQFIVAVVRKMGPEPLVPCKADKSDEEVAAFRNRAQRMYRKYCPERYATIDNTMKTYGGIEELMLETLQRKYGPEPKEDEVLPEIDDVSQQPESPNFSNLSMAVPPPQGGEPTNVNPIQHGADVGGAQGAEQQQQQQQQQHGGGGLSMSPELEEKARASAISLVNDLEERLRTSYARLEEAHQRAETLRNENIKLHEYSTKVMQDNDVITQELRRQLSEASKLGDDVRAQYESDKEKLHREHQHDAQAATQKLQEELLRGEQSKLEHQKTLSDLSAKLCEAEEQKGETTVQTQYLRQRVATLEEEMAEATKKIEEFKYRLKERDDVCHRGVQTGGDDAELRTELKQRKTAALRELESLGAEAQHWRSLATRLEAELRAAERRRDEIEKTSAEEMGKAGAALQHAKDMNFALEDRVAVLEAELLATPSASSGSAGEAELRSRVVELQRELAEAQATVRGQRSQVNDLRGLLAMHMASPQSKGATSVVSPGRGSAAAASSPSSARRSAAGGFSTSRR